MYPVRSRIVRTNAQFIPGLGEQLPSAAELMDTDPGVSALRSVVEAARLRIDTLKDALATTPKTKVVWRSTKGRGVTRYGPNPAYARAEKSLSVAEKNLEDAKRRLKEAEQGVWDRISKTVVYKGYDIKPIIDRGANSIVYQLKQKDGSNWGGAHQRLDEAKAVVDEEIRKRQEKDVEQWSKDRIAAEKATLSPGPSAMPQPKSKLPIILLAGGAAVAGLLLLR